MRLTVLSVAFPFAPVSPRTAGGAEQILATLDRSLTASGYASLVIAPDGSQVSGLLLRTPKVPTEITPEVQRQVRTAVRDLLACAVHDYAVDVVHLHGLDFLDYLPAGNIPVVVTLHLPLAWYPKEIFDIRRENYALVCVSPSQAETRASDHTGDACCLVIENGVDLDRFHPASGKGNYAACIGRICPEKAPHLALEAAEKSGMPLYLAGAAFGYESHRRYFEDLLAPRITAPHKFLGQVGGRAKRNLLAGAQCVLVPSLAPETSSLIAMEALACGTPVVAFRSGALAHLIEHGVTGFLVDSVAEMAQAIHQTQELNPAAGRRGAERRFSASRMANRYFDLYKSLITTGSTQVRTEALCLAN
jgi:glycosyltransferase involved in cell wall biosynthesis